MSRKSLYPCVLLVFMLVWGVVFGRYYSWTELTSHWISSLTMVLGSFVAGATPLGGGAVAFPVFTKVLGVTTGDAKTFSLMIQSVGMSFATLFFIARGIAINWPLIARLLPLSGLGLLIGLNYDLDGPYLKVLFSILLLLCSLLLVRSQQSVSNEWPKMTGLAYIIALGGGIISAYLGTGADTLLFFYLVYCLRMNAKYSIPTTVCFMACNSMIGSILLFFLHDLEQNQSVITTWFFAAPVVAIGAPLGGYIMSKLKDVHVLRFIKFLIVCEVLSTICIVDFLLAGKVLLLFCLVFILLLETNLFETLNLKIFSARAKFTQP